MICECRETDEKSLLILINDIYTIVFGVWHSSFYLQHMYIFGLHYPMGSEYTRHFIHEYNFQSHRNTKLSDFVSGSALVNAI